MSHPLPFGDSSAFWRLPARDTTRTPANGPSPVNGVTEHECGTASMRKDTSGKQRCRSYGRFKSPLLTDRTVKGCGSSYIAPPGMRRVNRRPVRRAARRSLFGLPRNDANHRIFSTGSSPSLACRPQKTRHCGESRLRESSRGGDAFGQTPAWLRTHIPEPRCGRESRSSEAGSFLFTGVHELTPQAARRTRGNLALEAHENATRPAERQKVEMLEVSLGWGRLGVFQRRTLSGECSGADQSASA
jgi:hypothetical protein